MTEGLFAMSTTRLACCSAACITSGSVEKAVAGLLRSLAIHPLSLDSAILGLEMDGFVWDIATLFGTTFSTAF